MHNANMEHAPNLRCGVTLVVQDVLVSVAATSVLKEPWFPSLLVILSTTRTDKSSITEHLMERFYTALLRIQQEALE